MSITKQQFPARLHLTREALLSLMRGETVKGTASPPGATMIEAQIEVSLLDPTPAATTQGVSEAERRAISDALTQDVPGAYQGSFTASSAFQDARPVVGTSTWLAMIASNADRIFIKVPRGTDSNGKPHFVKLALGKATEAEQAQALKSWLAAGHTPEWEMELEETRPSNAVSQDRLIAAAQTLGMAQAPEPADMLRIRMMKFLEHAQVVSNVTGGPTVAPPPLSDFSKLTKADVQRGVDMAAGISRIAVQAGKLSPPPQVLPPLSIAIQTPHGAYDLDMAKGEELDACGDAIGVSRVLSFGAHGDEPDDEYRARVRQEAERRASKHPPDTSLAATIRGLAASPVGSLAKLPPHVPTASHGMFSSKMEEPVREEARKLCSLIDWVEEQCAIIKNPHYVATKERELVESVKRLLLMPADPSTKQMQWLRDLGHRARVKAASVSTQLPPTPQW